MRTCNRTCRLLAQGSMIRTARTTHRQRAHYIHYVTPKSAHTHTHRCPCDVCVAMCIGIDNVCPLWRDRLPPKGLLQTIYILCTETNFFFFPPVDLSRFTERETKLGRRVQPCHSIELNYGHRVVPHPTIFCSVTACSPSRQRPYTRKMRFNKLSERHDLGIISILISA